MSQFSVLVDSVTQSVVVIDIITDTIVFSSSNEEDARDFALCAQFEEDSRIFAEFG